jgi:hypothetical protein
LVTKKNCFTELKKLIYRLEVLGLKKILIYVSLRPFRSFLLLKDTLWSIYKEKVFANYIYHYKTFNDIQITDESYSRKIDNYFTRYGKKINKYWHYCYANASGIYSEKYIPEIIYYNEIELFLNREEMASGYDDKNIYDKLFPDVLKPVSKIRCINGVFYDKDYKKLKQPAAGLSFLETDREYIIKPSIDGQGGRGVHKLIRNKNRVRLNSKEYDIADLPHVYNRDFLIQEIIQQHENLNKVYSKSLNTIRVISLRQDEEIVLLSAIIRFGNNGAFIDNESSGGLSCGIQDDGILKNFAVGKKLDKHMKHPYTETAFEGTVIPNFSKVKNLVKKLHQKLLYFDIVSWDIAINQDAEPVLIEMNLMEQGINFHQATNGPLFGDLTDEILGEVYG